MHAMEKEFGRIVLFTAMVLLINIVLLIISFGSLYFFIHLLLLIANIAMMRFLWIISPFIEKQVNDTSEIIHHTSEIIKR